MFESLRYEKDIFSISYKMVLADLSSALRVYVAESIKPAAVHQPVCSATAQPLLAHHAALVFWSNTAQAVPAGAHVCVAPTPPRVDVSAAATRDAGAEEGDEYGDWLQSR